MELGGKYYQDMDRLAALERGMKTWANWVDSNVDRSRTKVFFLGISPSHTKYDSDSLSLSLTLLYYITCVVCLGFMIVFVQLE